LYGARPGLAERVGETARQPVSRAWIERRLDECGAPAAPVAPAGATGTASGAQGAATPAVSAVAATPAVAAISDEALKRALRQVRNELFCTVMERDLSGVAEVAEVTGAMTDFAELAVQRALAMIGADLETVFGAPLNADGAPQALGVVGMGKLGGRELNVSSDIDLIFVYEEDGETAGGTRGPISNSEFFTRVARRLIGVLAEMTGDGYVFRVDMRLRPNGDSGPLVCSLAMLEEYFYVQGREWERYAWIKGRLVSETGSEAARRLARQLEALVQPFVYRRYLDFGVIGAIRALHLQIGQEAVRRATMRPDKADDIKLGRGGIREIEFAAQVFQLIRGGQDAGFRVRPTLAALDYAAARGLIGIDEVARLKDAYLFLRAVEHRLQYAHDAQTHAMPVDPDERARLAASLGFAGYDALLRALNEHRDHVERQFDKAFSDKRNGNGNGREERLESSAWIWSSALAEENADEELRSRLAALGFTRVAEILARLHTVWHSSRYTSLAERHRERFDTLVQRGLEAVRGLDAARRDDTMLRFLDLLEAVARRGPYLALLIEYPAALERVLAVLGGSRWAAGYLLRHPQLLDELLDDEMLGSPFDWPEFKRTLHARIEAADGAEQQMDLLRHAHQAEVFRILLLDLGGKLSVEHVSDRLSELADAVLDVTIQTVWQQFARRHRAAPRFSVIAYGKLGGKELGYASDIDIIFLYDDEDASAPERYATFARRLITWLSTSTGAGILFDIDLRLRPNGEAGLLVTDIDTFRRYQLAESGAANTAWVWEHQAISRARFSAGDPEVGARFEAIRAQVLSTPREPQQLAREIVSMRQRVLEGHPNRSDLFDLKHDRGGMVDIEFLVQYGVLLHAAAQPSLVRNTGNIALLREIARLGLISDAEAEQVGSAYRTYRKLQHAMRLDGMEKARVSPAQLATERGVVIGLWRRIFG
jgi:glutamate-ammonia-ligase adenylyltransferase